MLPVLMVLFLFDHILKPITAELCFIKIKDQNPNLNWKGINF